ncbi:MAG: ATP synthase subunit C [Oscillospiraceae bacterium]|nr:ATP synthase subunit C [Oscillospiraceae bacterium]
MNILELALMPLLILCIISLPFIAAFRKKKSAKTTRNAIILNLCSFFAVLALAVIFPIGGFISADAAEAAVSVSGSSLGLGYLAAALSVGLGSIGCGIAVASGAPAAIGAVAEEPKSFAKSLIFVALGEGVALYGFIIAFMIIGKL